jgi:AcrR family transcriptional regulator
MDRRSEIVRRAAEVLERKGIGPTSLEDIAGAVGVKRETLYYYFKDKSDILYNVIKPESDALLRGIELISQLPGPIEHKLLLAIESHLERFNPGYVEMSVACRALFSRERDPRLVELHKTWKDYEAGWVALIESGQKSKELAPEVDAKVVSFAILGMCNSLSTWYNPAGKVSIAELAQTFFRIAARGICVAPGPKE